MHGLENVYVNVTLVAYNMKDSLKHMLVGLMFSEECYMHDLENAYVNVTCVI
jgi:hypothetical protein